jgi:hypothetical protein
MSQMFQNFINRLDPAWTAFVCSILLSLMAIAASTAPNPDGMLYIETARIYLEGGVDAALALYKWNTIFIVIISRLHIGGCPWWCLPSKHLLSGVTTVGPGWFNPERQAMPARTQLLPGR